MANSGLDTCGKSGFEDAHRLDTCGNLSGLDTRVSSQVGGVTTGTHPTNGDHVVERNVKVK